MKKFSTIFIIVILTCILVGCGKTEQPVSIVTATPAPTAVPTAVPTTAPTPVPTPTPEPINITKSPTSEIKSVGETVIYIAQAENFETVQWFCKTVAGAEFKVNDLASYYAGVSVNGADKFTLTISNVQDAMDGCSFYATFYQADGTAKSTSAASFSISHDIVITHNPTSEYRDLGTNWYWDSERSCARNDSVYLQYHVDGTNIDTIQWYIYTDHASPAGNYAGVLGDNTNTVSIPARSDISGCVVYAVVSNSYGKSVQSSNANYEVTYIKSTPTPTPAYSYHTVYLDSLGNGGYVASYTGSGKYGDSMSVCLCPTNSQAYYDVNVMTTTSRLSIPTTSDGINYYYTMPNEDVYIVVTWYIPN